MLPLYVYSSVKCNYMDSYQMILYVFPIFIIFFLHYGIFDFLARTRVGHSPSHVLTNLIVHYYNFGLLKVFHL